jgi:hypothetical protein
MAPIIGANSSDLARNCFPVLLFCILCKLALKGIFN